MTSPSDYVTRDQLTELVQVIDRRMDAFERGLNRVLLVLGTAQVLTLVLLVLVLRKVGL
jgi:hypothetical protein